MISGQSVWQPPTKRLCLPGIRWANRSWCTPSPMRFQGVLMGCARCLSRRSARGSPTTESRPKVGPGRGTAKVIPPAPAYWDYAKAGHRLDSNPVLPGLLLSVRAYQSELEPQVDAIGKSNCFSVRPKMERVFAMGYRHPRESDVKAGVQSLPLARTGSKRLKSLD